MINYDSNSPCDQWEKRKARQNACPMALVLRDIVSRILDGLFTNWNQDNCEPTHKDNNWKDDVHGSVESPAT